MSHCLGLAELHTLLHTPSHSKIKGVHQQISNLVCANAVRSPLSGSVMIIARFAMFTLVAHALEFYVCIVDCKSYSQCIKI